MTTLEETLEDRGKDYGPFDTMSEIAQSLKTLGRTSPAWVKMTLYQREAFDMSMNKWARILNGNPHKPDSWIDLQGYARHVSNKLEGKS